MFVFVEYLKKKQCFIHLRQLTTNHDIKSKNMYYGFFVRTSCAENQLCSQHIHIYTHSHSHIHIVYTFFV